MGFFDKLKASVGIGGAKVQLQAKRGYYFGDENVEITVTLHGGKVAQKCHKLEVSVQRTRDVPAEEIEAKKAARRRVQCRDHGPERRYLGHLLHERGPHRRRARRGSGGRVAA